MKDYEVHVGHLFARCTAPSAKAALEIALDDWTDDLFEQLRERAADGRVPLSVRRIRSQSEKVKDD